MPSRIPTLEPARTNGFKNLGSSHSAHFGVLLGKLATLENSDLSSKLVVQTDALTTAGMGSGEHRRGSSLEHQMRGFKLGALRIFK